MSKWLAHFLQKTCQTSTDKTDTTLEMRDVSVMSVHDQGTFEKNNAISDDGKGKQQAIDLSLYIDYFDERVGIRESEAGDIAKNRSEAEWLAINDTLAQFMEDTNTPIQSKIIPEFLEKFYEATGFNLRVH